MKIIRNIDLGKTQLNEKMRVSSAAIFYENSFFGDYYQYETWIFSDNPLYKSRMFIWGTSHGDKIFDKYKGLTMRAHARISKIMLEKVKAFI